MLYLWSLVVILFLLSHVGSQEPIVNLPQGRLIGNKVYTKSSIPVEIYFGVPYATPPIDKYRFSAPERHPGWKSTLSARRIPPRCFEINNNGTGYYSENCLYLNIWTPRQGNGKLLPVVIVLYSESWLKGGVHLECQELASEGVVVVTMSYRLQLLAFFTLRSFKARGNLALLDQYLAMLWVRENIAAFGGDPAAVTLLGHSAGADSILYHMASTRAFGLFHRAIIMSPKNIWETITDPTDLNYENSERVSREIASALSCDSPSDEEILHCMQKRPFVTEIATYLMKTNISWVNSMRPMSDDFLPVNQQYLPTTISQALSMTNKAPMQLDILLGSTNLEFINNNGEELDELLKRDASFINEYANSKTIPELLKLYSLHRSEAVATLVQAIKWEYWNMNKKNSERNAQDAYESLAKAESSARWGAGIALLAARLARRVTRLYVYSYTRPGVNLYGKQHNFTGAVHGTDLISLLGDTMMLQVARRLPTLHEREFSSIFREFIVNFIKYGSPGSDDWLRYKVGDAYIYDISDGTNREVNQRYRTNRDATFWLQYLPALAKESSVHTEQLTSESDGGRLRGGVFAMCGVTVILLLLLGICVILLRRRHTRRFSITDDTSPDGT